MVAEFEHRRRPAARHCTGPRAERHRETATDRPHRRDIAQALPATPRPTTRVHRRPRQGHLRLPDRALLSGRRYVARPRWRANWPMAVMGENLSLCGLLEGQVWMGDRLRFPDCELIATAPRIPWASSSPPMGFAQAVSFDGAERLLRLLLFWRLPVNPRDVAQLSWTQREAPAGGPAGTPSPRGCRHRGRHEDVLRTRSHCARTAGHRARGPSASTTMNQTPLSDLPRAPGPVPEALAALGRPRHAGPGCTRPCRRRPRVLARLKAEFSPSRLPNAPRCCRHAGTAAIRRRATWPRRPFAGHGAGAGSRLTPPAARPSRAGTAASRPVVSQDEWRRTLAE